jgi:sialate O-acetylesterase
VSTLARFLLAVAVALAAFPGAPRGQSRNGNFAAARSADDRIRLLTIPKAGKPAPAAAFEAAVAWQVAGPETVRTFSAACYCFGREVQEMQRVPVGLLNASWGGTAIEPWIGESGLRSSGGFDARLDMLRLYARDEDAANQGLGRMWEDWWRGHGAAAGEPWKPKTPAYGLTCPSCGTGRPGALRAPTAFPPARFAPATTSWS